MDKGAYHIRAGKLFWDVCGWAQGLTDASKHSAGLLGAGKKFRSSANPLNLVVDLRKPPTTVYHMQRGLSAIVVDHHLETLCRRGAVGVPVLTLSVLMFLLTVLDGKKTGGQGNEVAVNDLIHPMKRPAIVPFKLEGERKELSKYIDTGTHIDRSEMVPDDPGWSGIVIPEKILTKNN